MILKKKCQVSIRLEAEANQNNKEPYPKQSNVMSSKLRETQMPFLFYFTSIYLRAKLRENLKLHSSFPFFRFFFFFLFLGSM